MSDEPINSHDHTVVEMKPKVKEPTEVEKTNAVLNEYTAAVFNATAGVAPNAIMATVAIQGKQLEVLIQMLAERGQFDPKEYNRRMRLACRKAIDDAKNRLVIAKDLPKPP